MTHLNDLEAPGLGIPQGLGPGRSRDPVPRRSRYRAASLGCPPPTGVTWPGTSKTLSQREDILNLNLNLNLNIYDVAEAPPGRPRPSPAGWRRLGPHRTRWPFQVTCDWH